MFIERAVPQTRFFPEAVEGLVRLALSTISFVKRKPLGTLWPRQSRCVVLRLRVDEP
jgi:hypothetical protein